MEEKTNEKEKNFIIILLIIIILLLIILLVVGILKKDKKIENNNTNTSNTQTQEINTSNVQTKNVNFELYKKDDSTLSKAFNKTVSGLKTHVVYSDKKVKKLIEEDEEYDIGIDLILTGDNEFYMYDGTDMMAGYYILGTYEIKNNTLILNQQYINGTDCRTEKINNTFTYEIKNGTIIVNDDLILKENKDSSFKMMNLLNDICEIDKEENEINPVSYKYHDNDYEIKLDFLLFNNYLLTYCNNKSCYTSLGTYTYDDNGIVLNQTKYQGNDVCYYKKNNKYNLSYTKLSEENIKKLNDKYHYQVVYFDTVTINLKDNEGFSDKDIVLKDNENIITNNIIKLYDSEDFFRVYCE